MIASLSPANTTIAFIGIGLMGQPMAANLLKAGYRVLLWNRTRSKAELLVPAGGEVYQQKGEAIAQADVVISMLETGAIVDQLLYQQADYQQAKPNCLFIDMSSIPPALARQHAAQAEQAGYRYLDAPVSGGTVGAEQATLSIMVGGNTTDFSAASELFGVLGKPHHIGDHGTGQLAKLANQAIVGITIGAVSEALLLAEAGGANPVAVREALSGGFASSRILELHGQRMIERNFTPGARSRVQLKDLNTIVDEASLHNIKLPLTESVRQQYQRMVDDGLEDLDHSGLFQQLLNQHPGLLDAKKQERQDG
ncbi:MAG: NAD(P)-dependent oxidoreductase [Halopseudomonas sp.]